MALFDTNGRPISQYEAVTLSGSVAAIDEIGGTVTVRLKPSGDEVVVAPTDVALDAAATPIEKTAPAPIAPTPLR